MSDTYKMLIPLLILFISSISKSEEVNNDAARPIVVLPIPLELPFRNERAHQCWMRIEDVELTETYTVYCTIANAFLKMHLSDYNKRKQAEDAVEVTPWSNAPKVVEDDEDVPYASFNGQKTVKDWRTTTYFDPTSKVRVYVTEKADCRLIMYSRDSMTNYKVNCEKVLFFINDRMLHSSGNVNVSSVFALISAIFVYMLNS